MHHISSQDEELGEMKSRLSYSLGGKPHCKKKEEKRQRERERDLQVRNVWFWQTKVTFIQVVPDALFKQRSQIERHQDCVKNNAAVCSYLSL